MKKNELGGLVYSTEHGRLCPECGHPVASCLCGAKQAPAPGDGIVRVGRQTKGRKGKGVTVITGLPVSEAQLKALAKELKTRCGAGGAVKEARIEIQGDHREFLIEELGRRGWKARPMG
ncbi:MAG: translation initiation factor Sui1 [Syntrophobacteraceae bacterium]